MIILQASRSLQVNLSPIKHFKLMSIVGAIPLDWRLILINYNQQHSAPQTLNDTISVIVDGKEVDILTITSKLVWKVQIQKTNPSNCPKEPAK